MDELFLLLLACGAVGAILAVATVLRRRRTALPAASEDRERRELRLNAPFDRSAAMELRSRLLDDLKRHEAVRRHLQHDGGTDREVALLLQSVERADQETRQQIAQVEAWLGPGG